MNDINKEKFIKDTINDKIKQENKQIKEKGKLIKKCRNYFRSLEEIKNKEDPEGVNNAYLVDTDDIFIIKEIDDKHGSICIDIERYLYFHKIVTISYGYLAAEIKEWPLESIKEFYNKRYEILRRIGKKYAIP